MKVVVSVFGRFHAFDMARTLYHNDALCRLITSYPKSWTTKFGVPRSYVCSLSVLEAGARLARKSHGLIDQRFFASTLFGRLIPYLLPEEFDVFVGWSGRSLSAIRKANKRDAITILERGSSHPLYAAEILEEEFARYAPSAGYKNPERTNDLREYDEADYISIPSTFVKRTFLEKGFDESRLLVNPYGVDLLSFPCVDKPDIDNKIKIVFVGSASLRKGIHYLLTAFDELDAEKYELTLVGGMSPEIRPYYEARRDRVNWVGIKPQSKLFEYYNQADVFVMPSIEEGLAMVQVQAMACGLPLICTTNTGGEDLLVEGESGFTIPIRSSDAIVEKLDWFYRNRNQCRTMGMSARRRVEEHYTWDDYGKRLLDMMRALVAK